MPRVLLERRRSGSSTRGGELGGGLVVETAVRTLVVVFFLASPSEPPRLGQVGALVVNIFDDAVDVVHVLARAERNRLLQLQCLLAAQEIGHRAARVGRAVGQLRAETAHSAKEAQTSSSSLRAKMQRSAYAGGGQANFLPSYGAVGSKRAARPISWYPLPLKFARISSPRSV